MDPQDAIIESARNRLRPIFMTASSILGFLPLVVSSGAGSELYRGMGAVQLGGMLVSTLFTLILVPTVFSLWLDGRSALASLFRRKTLAVRVEDALMLEQDGGMEVITKKIDQPHL